MKENMYTYQYFLNRSMPLKPRTGAYLLDAMIGLGVLFIFVSLFA